MIFNIYKVYIYIYQELRFENKRERTESEGRRSCV